MRVGSPRAARKMASPSTRGSRTSDDDDVEDRRGQPLQRGGAVAHRHDVVPGRRERGRDGEAHVGIVLDEQNAQHDRAYTGATGSGQADDARRHVTVR